VVVIFFFNSLFSLRKDKKIKTWFETGGVAEPVRVEDEHVENKNQDDGAGPDKETDEAGVWEGGRALHNVMVMVKVGEGGMEMMTPWRRSDEDEDEVLEEENDGWE